ncbi:N-acetylgalactosamine kinase [Podochytrium sp. JEL0797]|nr:N-acetylgalactosamine kinase [Podochytrium sp. JEL0797]
MDTTPIPHVTSLEEIYRPAPSPATTDRYKHLATAFQQRFGHELQFIARSPGRVNIIGEHIDYCGFSVLPMAVDRDVLVAVYATPNTSTTEPSVITLTNTDSQKYKDTTFTHSFKDPNVIEIDASLHAWSNYFKCGYKGIHESTNPLPTPPPHLSIMISGTVPAGAGLSSSSAFVCASAVATAHSLHLPLLKQSLTQTSIRAERYCGVQTGGMDQSISVMANPSAALLIQFHPELKATPVEIPSHPTPYRFVVANSLVTADKHVTSAKNYNLRVVETRVAAALMAAWVQGLHEGKGVFAGVQTLRDVVDLYVAQQQRNAGPAGVFVGTEGAKLIATLRNLESLNETIFHDASYSCQDVVVELQKHYGAATFPDWDSVARVFCQGIQGVFLEDGLAIKKRVRHVLSEARRVEEFTRVCALEKPFYQGGDVLTELGALMTSSQRSCAQDFNCSCPELDTLTALCLASGAVGSRLTGAGWGGCTVSLVPADKVDEFIRKVTEGYYAKREKDLSKIGDWIFATTPGVGAVVLEGVKF